LEYSGKRLSDGTVVPSIDQLSEQLRRESLEKIETIERAVGQQQPLVCAFAADDKILVISPAGQAFVVDGQGQAVPVMARGVNPDRMSRVNFRWGLVLDEVGDLVRAIDSWNTRIRLTEGVEPPPPPAETTR
jgi:hypothetical protein